MEEAAIFLSIIGDWKQQRNTAVDLQNMPKYYTQTSGKNSNSEYGCCNGNEPAKSLEYPPPCFLE